MEKIELQEIIEACEEAESEYIKLYRPLLGYEDDVTLYRGIDDSMEGTLNEIEQKTGIQFPADFLQIYLIANGGKYFDINLYYLTTDKTDPNGLYAKNFDSSLRAEYNIPENTIIIGENKDGEYILVGIDDDGYYAYCTWDKDQKVMGMDFGYLAEILVYEIDYYTQAFTTEAENEENNWNLRWLRFFCGKNQQILEPQ